MSADNEFTHQDILVNHVEHRGTVQQDRVPQRIQLRHDKVPGELSLDSQSDPLEDPRTDGKTVATHQATAECHRQQ